MPKASQKGLSASIDMVVSGSAWDATGCKATWSPFAELAVELGSIKSCGLGWRSSALHPEALIRTRSGILNRITSGAVMHGAMSTMLSGSQKTPC